MARENVENVENVNATVIDGNEKEEGFAIDFDAIGQTAVNIVSGIGKWALNVLAQLPTAIVLGVVSGLALNAVTQRINANTDPEVVNDIADAIDAVPENVEQQLIEA